MSWSYSSQLISFMLSFNLRFMSVSSDGVENIQNSLEEHTTAIFPVGVFLFDGFNVVAFQPNCKCNLWK